MDLGEVQGVGNCREVAYSVRWQWISYAHNTGMGELSVGFYGGNWRRSCGT